ncbi:MAG: pilus assembly protein [Pigmentiphaga sp.]|uniref:TadE/TadG family type IV pilus assembly protein n=1 Tax=Pigmentiphaga sp. TaxID=1977564 RepID=UPI0029BE5F0F|nr:TadE/TadG family type IV pilus assembly protein [Pigmentiphaga sp.]MDX3907736.1 pilus assembly protein [Pigmentiphaga sp.]
MTRPVGFPVARAAQRGIAALEFALVSVLFLIVLFGIISYGGLFIVQQSLSRAVEEGARVALQSTLNGQPGRLPSQADACSAVAKSVDWLNQHRAVMGQGPVLCQLSPPQACSYTAGLRCASLVVTYAGYRKYPLVPEMLPLGSWLQSLFGPGTSWIPEDLSAAATVQLGKSLPGT